MDATATSRALSSPWDRPALCPRNRPVALIVLAAGFALVAHFLQLGFHRRFQPSTAADTDRTTARQNAAGESSKRSMVSQLTAPGRLCDHCRTNVDLPDPGGATTTTTLPGGTAAPRRASTERRTSPAIAAGAASFAGAVGADERLAEVMAASVVVAATRPMGSARRCSRARPPAPSTVDTWN